MSKEMEDFGNSPVLSQDSDMDFNKDVEKNGQDNMDINDQDEMPVELAKLDTTKSIAESFSFTHEIAFIIVICMAQLTTRKYFLFLLSTKCVVFLRSSLQL
jgi:hypothetical protein